MTKQNRAVLWDMDGTLIDSSEYHWHAWHTALASADYQLTRELFAQTFGRRSDEAVRYYLGQDYPPAQIEEIVIAKENLYRDLIRRDKIQLLPGADYWLTRLQAQGFYQVLATSAPIANVEAIMEVADIIHYFDQIVSAEDVQRGKPDPQVFLISASKVGIEPINCIVVEDAPVGIEAARRAGMRSIGILSVAHTTLAADRVIHSLTELDDDAFGIKVS